MISNSQLLRALPPFTNKRQMLVYDQNVNDIINAIVEANETYKKDYQLIYSFFVGSDEIETAKNVFNYIKQNIDYVIEPDTKQTIKSPGAIIATGKKQYGGNDCKNMALMTAGIMNAYRNNENKKFDLYFRFASYEQNEKTPQHVFVVMKINGREIWIDPVLDYFNEKRQPHYIKDKKINMSLIGLSGVNPYANDKKYFANNEPGSVGEISDPYTSIISTALTLFIGNNAPNPNDWKGWTPGDVKHWVSNDGDSIKNEAVNIISYIKAHGLTDIVDSDSFGVNRVTVDQIANKLSRAGYSNEANQLLNSNESSSIIPGVSSTKAGMNIWVTLGLVGAGLFLITKMKK